MDKLHLLVPQRNRPHCSAVPKAAMLPAVTHSITRRYNQNSNEGGSGRSSGSMYRIMRRPQLGKFYESEKDHVEHELKEG